MPHRTPYRLAAVDIDDTLLGPDARVSAENAAAVAELARRGVRVVLASGRSHANMLPFHRELGLGAGPVISSHGAVARDAEGDGVWFVRPVPPALAAEVTREGRARGFSVVQYRLDGVYVQARTPWTDYEGSRNAEPQHVVADLTAPGGTDVTKVMWIDDPAAVARAVPGARAAFGDRLTVTPTDAEYLEFCAAGVDKGSALAAVAERLGVSRAQVLAFGDGNNDVAMLAWAGLGVAMDHARPAAQRAARLVAPEGDPETSLARAVALALGGTPAAVGA